MGDHSPTLASLVIRNAGSKSASVTTEEKWESERQRLVEEQAALQGDWRRIGWLFGTAVLAIPAAILFGLWGAVLVVLAAGALVLVSAYLIGTRIKVNTSELREAEETLERLRRGE